MKNKVKEALKRENGSVTVFVLASILLILSVSIIIYISIVNKSSTQNKNIDKIQESYGVNAEEEMEEAYNNISKNDGDNGDGDIEEVDKSELIELLKRARAIERGDYTLDSWENLQKEIEKGQNVVDNKSATKDDVKNAIIGLADAISGLKRLNKEDLGMVIELVQKIVDNIDKYQPDTVVGIEEKLERGKAIYNSNDVTQKQIDEIMDELLKASLEARLKPDVDL